MSAEERWVAIIRMAPDWIPQVWVPQLILAALLIAMVAGVAALATIVCRD